jgi:diacylglycerol kinase family enzyme
VELAAAPYGITNDFVKSFGKKNEHLFRDFSLLADADTIRTDIIHCGSNYAMNFCLIGTEAAGAMQSAKMSRIIEQNMKALLRLLMPVAFMVCGISGHLDKKVRMQRYEITIDDQEYVGNYGGINVANGSSYGGGHTVVIEAMPNDGLLNVLFFNSMSFLKTLSIIPDYLKGLHKNYPSIFNYQLGKKVAIRSEIPLIVNLDGESFFDTNLEIEIVPDAVRFVAPKGLQYERMVSASESK